MIQHYNEPEGDGMDPGLGDLAYDGTEYELDEFGERIGSDDLVDDYADDMPLDTATDENVVPLTDAGKIERGFGETINPDSNPHIDDQLSDETLRQEAEADYKGTNTQASTQAGAHEDEIGKAASNS